MGGGPQGADVAGVDAGCVFEDGLEESHSSLSGALTQESWNHHQLASVLFRLGVFYWLFREPI